MATEFFQLCDVVQICQTCCGPCGRKHKILANWFDVGQWTYGFISVASAATALGGLTHFDPVDSLARLGKRDTPKMNADQYQAFQNSPFMQGVRKTEAELDLCWTFTCDRDERRKKTDPSFKPTDDDFGAPKAHEFDRCINYYKATDPTVPTVLGIDEYATQEEVKKAYKKLSLVYHPDKTAGMGAEQKEEYAAIFIELKNAYLTLSDNPTRRQYDREKDRDKASFEINGFKPKTRAHFDASEVLKKLQEMQKPPGKHLDIAMSVKLEKFFYGGHKGIRRERRVKDFGGFNQETRIYRVDIPRGAVEPHEVTFRQGGDHHEDTRPDTLCFKMTSGPQCMLRVAFLVLNSGALALKSHHRSTMITSLNKSKSMKILCYEGE
ncbi:unnamed protein product [Cladocopium goreaui]|uniref:Chaperone protein DnaJ n=1 Tax=Cladocopium goreaui TaxID=2562237 RepID=A0A9P1FMV8_9DINO|nr:unnamed protein product [Cladocopium goreaui]